MYERWIETSKKFFPPLKKRDGIPETELKSAEKRLGFAMPSGLREMYKLAGRRRDLHASYDRLLAPNKLMTVHGALVFYEEHDNTLAWGIMKTACGEDDPPVVRAKNEPPFTWERDHDALSQFFFTELLWQQANTPPCVTERATPGISAKIASSLERVELEGCHRSIDGCFASSTTVAILRDGEVHAGATSEDDLEALKLLFR